MTAEDECGETASLSFIVEVLRPNRAPVVERTIQADTVKAEKSRVLGRSLSGYFDDLDGDPLEYEAESSNTSKLTVSLTGGVLTLAGVAKGSATVTVTARDTDGLTMSQVFEVTVVPSNTAPAFNPDELERAVAENTASGVAVGDPVTAEDPDTADTLSYSLKTRRRPSSGDTEGTMQVSAAGLSESDTVVVAFGTLPNTVVAAAPSEAKVVVVSNTADMRSRLAPLVVEYAELLYTAVAGGTPADITLRITPAADREVVVPVTRTRTIRSSRSRWTSGSQCSDAPWRKVRARPSAGGSRRRCVRSGRTPGQDRTSIRPPSGQRARSAA